MQNSVNIHETDGGSVTEALPKNDPTEQLRRANDREKVRQRRLREREEA